MIFSVHPFISHTAAGLVIILLVGSGACRKGPYQAESTRVMAQHLQEVISQIDPLDDIYSNDRRVAAYRNMPLPGDPAERLHYQANLGQELLLAGKTEEAIEKLEAVRDSLKQGYRGQKERLRNDVEDILALAYLRLGEQENCLRNHSSQSCLLPIRGAGRHKLERGSRGAIEVYTGILTKHPDDMVSRWLLNIAYMTLGEHPQQVPPQWLIPEEAFQPEYDIGHFPEVASQLGLDVIGLAGGSIMEDMDRDGLLDIVVSSWGLNDQIRYFRNNGDGTFSDRTLEAGLEGIVGGLNTRHADYNNDGYPDVMVLRGAWRKRSGRIPNSLLRNNGDGTFDDVTEEAGLLSYYPTQTAAWGDYDNDGWLDLFIGNESFHRPNPCELYRNNGDGTFTNVAREAGVAVTGYIKAVDWGDYDNDGLQDLYISRLDGPNLLFHNQGLQEDGSWKFLNVSGPAGVREPIRSFPTWFWDYDNDGWLDIFVSGYFASSADVAREYLGLPTETEYPRLYRNNHDGTFTDVTKGARLNRVMYTMGCNFGDLDNDGWLDFYVGTGDPDYRALMPNRMFHNAAGEFFQEVTTSGGFGQLQKGHGVSYGDLDNDGDQDIYAVTGGAFTGDTYQNTLYHNPGHGNNWITLRLEGVTSNRSAIGARIRLVAVTPGGERSIYATVGENASFGGNSLQQEIGLGGADRIRVVEVTWPTSGQVQRFRDLEINRTYYIREDAETARPVEVQSFQLPSGSR